MFRNVRVLPYRYALRIAGFDSRKSVSYLKYCT